MSLHGGPAINRQGPSLTVLPPETLTAICQYFCSHIGETEPPRVPDALLQHAAIRADDELPRQLVDEGSLHALCLTSKYTRSIAQPVLYHTFAPGCGNTSPVASGSWDQQLALFLRTIWKRRDLAALVRRLVIHPTLLQRVASVKAIAITYDILVEMKLPSTGDATLLSWVYPTWPSWPYARRYNASGGLTQDLVQMLVHLLPNLSHLTLHISSYMLFKDLPGCVQSTLEKRRDKPQLPLKILDVYLYATKPGLLDLGRTASSILALAPQLETLNIDMARQDLFYPRHEMPNLKHLRITHSWFDGKQMGEFLRAALGGLETFMYEIGSPSTMRWWKHFSPANIIESLHPHQSTLTMMHLDLRRHRSPDNVLEDEQDDPRTMPTLRDFGGLTRLVLDVDSVYNNHTNYGSGRDILTGLLPSNIVFFGLAGSPKTTHIPLMMNSLDGLADAVRHAQFVGLREIRCDIDLEPGSGGLPGRFAAAGVRLTFCHWPLSMPAKPTDHQ
ncbi:hypothetical protein GQ53DRAFT_845127 [Thozetella sp. PMI_491]|nr:hypothetical protein GQ53DRAFT_845127 [Thozetella sp. PMI_491]